MNPSSHAEVFRHLVTFALDYESTHPDANEHEAAYFAVLAFCRASTGPLRETVEAEFISLLRTKGARGHDLVAYCMRDLQWLGVRNCAHDIYERETDLRTKRVLRAVEEVYQKNWGGDEVYSIHRNRKNR